MTQQSIERAIWNSIHTLVFDFGDTLVNSSTNIRTAWAETIQNYDIEYDTFISIFLDTIFLHEGALSNEDKVRWTLKQMDENHDQSISSSELLSDFRTNFEEKCRDNLHKDPFGTWHFLKRISEDQTNEYNFELGILSDNSIETKQLWNDLFAEFGLEDLFSFFIVSEEVGKWKPDPAMFNSVYSLDSCQPGELIYFGNNLQRDAPSSKYGYQFVHVYGLDSGNPSSDYSSMKYINQEEFDRVYTDD